MAKAAAYVVASRRTALGRLGGLHRSRRVPDLAAPVISQVLTDAGLSPAKVDLVIVGNGSETGNPARIVALTAGLPDGVPALTLDQQCASGLAALVQGVRAILTGDAEIVVVGGAEALSMAPWMVAKPRAIHQLPSFLAAGSHAAGEGAGGPAAGLEADERLAKRLKISREQQDAYTLQAHLRASVARDARRFVNEIVLLKTAAEEGRDQSAGEPDADELAALPPLLGTGTLTAANVAGPHDGAAFAAVVGEETWVALGRPPALRFVTCAGIGVAMAEVAEAPMAATRRLLTRTGKLTLAQVGVIELAETTSAQAIAYRNALSLSDDTLNPDGGAVVRGHPLGASGAVLVSRLFTRMARAPAAERAAFGLAVQGARGGQGLAVLFEAV